MKTIPHFVIAYLLYALVVFVVLAVFNALIYRRAIKWDFVIFQTAGLVVGKVLMDALM